MALKDLVVHVDPTPASANRVDAAIGLAQRHEAHLIGVYVITPPYMQGFVRQQIGEDLLRRQAELLLEAARRAQADFDERTARAGISAEWRAVEGNVEPMLALNSRYSDLTVVGQRDPDQEVIGADPDMPDRLILSVGRPVLVVPSIGTYPKIGERVMIAWDASRLATRAVHDAMPLLEAARHVSVMAVNPHGGREGHGDVPSADICQHLARHGIACDAQHVFADDLDVGDMLLSRAADQGIDLLVMGAYGHARWRELVLGGVTRHMLGHMTMPVLMSH